MLKEDKYKEVKTNPTHKAEDRLKEIYDHIDNMVDLRHQRQRYFNDRTFIEFIDDNEKRWNSYTPSRESQDKDNWQANFFHPTTRNKVKAMIASAASTVPAINMKATNSNQKTDFKRADVLRNLVKHSYSLEDMTSSIQTDNFFEALEIVSLGTCITHCAYESIMRDNKTITSYDVSTGEYEFETKKELVKDQCTDTIVPLDEIYVSTLMCKHGSIQAQPRMAWIKYYTKDEFDDEFGEYKNADKVKTEAQYTKKEEKERFMHDSWSQRVKDADGQIEVSRVYSNLKDEYVIVANGVILLDVPMLWEYKNEKVYPFAKTIFEPFATNFFYGNALPNSMMGEQDVVNSLYNMMVDKTYRTLDRQLLIGDVNRDSFDLDDQSAQDSIIYVSDISQAKETPMSGVSQSEFNMVSLMSRGLDLSSVDDNQSGVTGKGVTAREIVLANENAKRLGGIFKMFLTNHWKQKYILRIVNILRFYPQEKVDMSLGLDSPEVKNNVFAVDDAEMANGQKGTLNIEIVPEGQPMPTRQELDAREEEVEKEGQVAEFIAIKSDFLDNWQYDVTVIADDVDGQNDAINQAKLENKLKTIATAFPQLFMLNQEKFFKDTVTAFGYDPDSLETSIPVMPAQGPVEGEEAA